MFEKYFILSVCSASTPEPKSGPFARQDRTGLLTQDQNSNFSIGRDRLTRWRFKPSHSFSIFVTDLADLWSGNGPSIDWQLRVLQGRTHLTNCSPRSLPERSEQLSPKPRFQLIGSGLNGLECSKL